MPLLFTSSTSVYAQTDGSVVTEESPAIPDRETGSLLLAAETVTLARWRHCHPPVRHLRSRPQRDLEKIPQR